MTISQITIAAVVIAVLGIVALVAMGWRARSPAAAPGAPDAAQVREHPAPLEAPTPPLRRLRAAAEGVGLAVWIGMALATVVGLTAAYAVVRLTDMLQR